MDGEPHFFDSPGAFGEWLEENYDTEEVLWVGYWKVATGRASLTWEESVREALCWGWIDGLRRSVDDESYKIRFTPRKPDSHWSQKNVGMVEELIAEDRMRPPGLAAWERRDPDNTARATYEREHVDLPEEYLDQLRADPTAWRFFQDLPPGYTRTSVHWVMSAKQEKTRLRRLGILVESCAEGKKIPPLRRG